MDYTYNIARDFSTSPSGRCKSDSNKSGEHLKEALDALLKSYEHVVVEFDGTLGYGSSFLEAAFGGLIRLGWDPTILHCHLILNSQDTSLIREIWDYVDNAVDSKSEIKYGGKTLQELSVLISLDKQGPGYKTMLETVAVEVLPDLVEHLTKINSKCP